MSLRTVARRYAHALFDVAKQRQTVERAEGAMTAFTRLLDAHPELRRVLDNPAVPARKKRAILEVLLEKTGEIDGEVRQLVLMLADRDRLGLWPEVVSTFAERLRQERHIVQAEVVTAVPLEDAQRAALTTALRRAADADVAVTERVDPSIIGGVVARVGSHVFDTSVIRHLERMKQQFRDS